MGLIRRAAKVSEIDIYLSYRLCQCLRYKAIPRRSKNVLMYSYRFDCCVREMQYTLDGIFKLAILLLLEILNIDVPSVIKGLYMQTVRRFCYCYMITLLVTEVDVSLVRVSEVRILKISPILDNLHGHVSSFRNRPIELVSLLVPPN